MLRDEMFVWISLGVGVALLLIAIALNSPMKVEGRAVHEFANSRINVDDVTIIDGDTIKVKNVSYRLMGFDTPETFQAKCPDERRKGEGSKRNLARLIFSAKNVSINIKRKDRYNRFLAKLYVDGKDVAEIMIAEGYAVEYHGKGKRKDWCNE